MEKQNLIKIEIFGMERHDINNNAYMAYRAKTKKGAMAALKFTRNVTPTPTYPHGYIWVNEEDINLSNTGRFPTFWVNNIVDSCEIDEQKVNIAEMF